MSFWRWRKPRGHVVGWSGRGGWYRRGWCRGLMRGVRFVSRMLRGWQRLWCLGRWYLIRRGGIVRGRVCRLGRGCLWGDGVVFVVRDGDGWLLGVGVDRGWLNDPGRVFPVRVDPQVDLGEVATRGFKSNGQRNTNYGVQVGNTNVNGVWRTAVSFPLERVWGQQVVDVGVRFDGLSSD